jgi:ribosomal protein S18 acetylase RimI-like enzyme
MYNERLTVKAMSEDDLDIVLQIQSLAYDPFFHESRAVFLEKLNLFPRGCWIAYLDECPVAYLFSHPWSQNSFVGLDTPLGVLPEAPDCLYIHDLSVDPKFKGRGIGRKMVARAKELAVELGLAKMVLVSVQNSVGFWTQCGFEPVEELTNERKELRSYGPDACLMSAIIAE